MSRTARRVASPRPVNGAARRTTVLSSSTVQSCIATMATTCWASTSSGLAGTCSSSIAPTRIRPAVTAEGTRSPRWVGKSTPRETAPTWWPARPTRCRPEATDGGAPTWITRSTAPMSMPSSRDDVATTAGRWPDLSSVSVRVRSARLIDPWWARARMPLASRVSMPTAVPDCAVTWAAHSVPGSGTPAPWRAAHTSFIRAVSRSAPRRELVKTSVERCAATRSTTRSSTCGQIDGRGTAGTASGPVPGTASGAASDGAAGGVRSVRSGTGTTTWISTCFATGGWTTVTVRPPSLAGRAPERKRATFSTGRTVADSPIRCAGRGVAGPHADHDLRHRETEARRRLPDPDQRRAQVALDVGGEGLQRRHVEHPTALGWVLGYGLGDQPVEGPQEGGEGLAGTRRSHHERVLARPDRGPCPGLGRRGLGERPGEPRPGGRRETREGVGHLAAHPDIVVAPADISAGLGPWQADPVRYSEFWDC